MRISDWSSDVCSSDLLIGPLQTNKVKDALEIFDVIETLDRPKLAGALAREAERLGRAPACYIQVNTGEEPQKAGVMPGEADAFVAACRGLQLKVAGLMCIPPVDEEAALHFALLREIARRNGLSGLSMGMSGDYETAVRFGATLRSEEHTSELQSLMRISYAVFCLKKKNTTESTKY